MAEYADYDFAQMRSDAVRRVEEMKKRSRSYVEQENQAPHRGRDTARDAQKQADDPPKPARSTAKENGPLPDGQDSAPESDTFILLLLSLILSKEGADQSLIFALLYMLL